MIPDIEADEALSVVGRFLEANNVLIDYDDNEREYNWCVYHNGEKINRLPCAWMALEYVLEELLEVSVKL